VQQHTTSYPKPAPTDSDGACADSTPVPCINGTQTWPEYLYPGIITTHPTGTEDYSIRGKFKGEELVSHPRLEFCFMPVAR
jgi:hypothetical protein